VDGTVDAEYGTALAVQNSYTQWGDNQNELNAAYATISGGNLHLMLTGNLQDNGNSLDIFIDSVSGGMNVLSSLTSSDNFAGLNGFQFDTGFTADYIFSANRNSTTLWVDTIDLSSPGTLTYVGNVTTQGVGATLSGGTNPNGIQLGYDNSNTGGVGGTLGQNTGGESVTTGYEFLIPLAALGNPTGDIKIMAQIADPNHVFRSNQVLGGLGAGASQSNTNWNYHTVSGDQFFVIPEPGSLVLVAIGMLGLIGFTRTYRNP
jgi:hypothetical protein